ncbi:GNAT family N-acetyltransferase [Echinimonas agarilytica]|uniref:GNAT family N-acetyltransferase n=2 Tax=Echinimonas agarilytica TaxID=1215918 RepID=A0AA41W513_9GAMM|nr:GNAT family N-acetyltransferase [Echinimonas agarilytica]
MAASLLYQAYHDDPMFMKVFDASKLAYEQKLRALFREELDVFWQYEQPVIGAFEGETLLGVSCINLPESPLGGERFWNWRMKMLMSAGVVSTGRLIEKEQRIAQAMPNHQCHQLSLIAVAPNYQKQGVGETLLCGVDCLVEEHLNSSGCAIFVSNQNAAHWLNQHGYNAIQELSFSNFEGSLLFKEAQKIDKCP